jgi:hypothetical protein
MECQEMTAAVKLQSARKQAGLQDSVEIIARHDVVVPVGHAPTSNVLDMQICPIIEFGRDCWLSTLSIVTQRPSVSVLN